LSRNVDNRILILFWQFTIKTLEELDVVSNQHLSIEMFLIRLIYLKSIKNISNISYKNIASPNENIDHADLKPKKEDNDLFGIREKAETVGQMKNIAQEKDIKLKESKEIEIQASFINSFDDLLKICSSKKEIKLKYELEKNVNLVSFENQRMEISFNEDLDINFIKDLSLKLYEWTNKRWIITLSKTKGQPSKKEKEVNLKSELIESVKNTTVYKEVLERFPDAEIIDVKTNKKENKND